MAVDNTSTSPHCILGHLLWTGAFNNRDERTFLTAFRLGREIKNQDKLMTTLKQEINDLKTNWMFLYTTPTLNERWKTPFLRILWKPPLLQAMKNHPTTYREGEPKKNSDPSSETKPSMTPKKNTPMMEQYLAIKEQYKEAILFYRMGDFYEMFLEDARKASAILEIALTSRNKNDSSPIPMCGIPFRAADTYIAKLIGSGCKVAVCDQVEDAALAKGLVKREVVRVITPGMILNESLLDKKYQ